MEATKLLEQFNAEFPNGDSLELAQFVLAHAQDDQEAKPGEVFLASDSDNIESITVHLRPDTYPRAYQNKVDELVEQGAFDTREEAEKWVQETPFVLELYYEKDNGLFAVESDALDNCGYGSIVTPYGHKPIVTPED